MADRRNLHWLNALGKNAPPDEIRVQGVCYRRSTTLKHDFFAATALYVRPQEPAADSDRPELPGKMVLKLGRVADVCGLSLRPIGRWLARREAHLYAALQDLDGVPRYFGTWADHGFIHEYVEGHPLRRGEWVDDAFFPRLRGMLAALHARDIAYVDLEKRENILVGDDGEPYLIDFQISFALPAGRWRRSRAARFLLTRLQRSDRYHLFKHQRRHRPDQLTAEELKASYRPPFYITLHRVLFRPWTLLRRQTLRRLYGGQWTPRMEARRAGGGACDVQSIPEDDRIARGSPAMHVAAEASPAGESPGSACEAQAAASPVSAARADSARL